MSSTNTAVATDYSSVKSARDRVEFVERVAVDAFRGVLEMLADTTVGILRRCEKAKVFVIAASSISAEMIYNHSIWNWSNKVFIHDAMKHLWRLDSIHLDSSVLQKVRSGIDGTNPFPAIGFIIQLKLIYDAFKQWLWRSSSKLLVSLKSSSVAFGPIHRSLFRRRLWVGLNLQVVGFCRRIRFSFFPLAVVPVRHWDKMIGVYASSVTASVMKLCSTWNKAKEYFKRYAVGFYTLLAEGLKLPISFSRKMGSPIPASCFPIQFKLFYETIKQWSIGRHNEKPIRAPKVKSAHDWPQSGHGLESSLFSCFWRLLQSRALA